MNVKRLPLPIGLVIALTAATATGLRPRASGDTCTPVLGSEVCTWVVMDGERVVELGADIPMALIESVPTDVEMVWPPAALAVVALPEGARAALGLDHMAVNWEAHGHPPATFLTRHFDFHFYNITREEVEGIDCVDASKPSELPAGYALPDIEAPGLGMLVGLCVPHMGMHAMPEADVAATDVFEASMIVGYYGGRPVFFEPMVSRDVLLGRSDFTVPMPRVGGLPSGVRYPTRFRAEYDEDSDQYRLVFGGFPGA